MPRPATGQTPVRNLRVPDEIWKPALANAQAEGKTITEVITSCLKRYNASVSRRSARAVPPNEDFDGGEQGAGS